MPIRWFDDLDRDDVAVAGGKGASLGELVSAGLPVPDGFVVTAATYREFIERAGIDGELRSVLDVDPENPEALAEAAERARELVSGTDIPQETAEEIEAAYDGFGNDPFVAVRSSATAEDLPEASFAGQQDTHLNVTREELVERVQDCWASLFTERAVSYRVREGFEHDEVDMAVVVQRMVDAEKSGVMFTRDPTTGAKEMTVEGAWGLGEGVVSGQVSPDNYVLDHDGSVKAATVATKRTQFLKDPETGETEQVDVPEDKQQKRVLSEPELRDLAELGREIEAHYGEPQDVEWAITDGEVSLLQSRPLTTIDEEAGAAEEEPGPDAGEVLVNGHGASPGTTVGPARVITNLDELDAVGEGDIIVTAMTTPDMVPAMQRAGGIVTDEGGLTSHAAIVSREVGVPAVTGTENATTELEDGDLVEINGERGTVSVPEPEDEAEETSEPEDGGSAAAAAESAGTNEDVRPQTPVKPMTATEVKVNVSFPDSAERAAATGADGVGLLRLEHLIIRTGKTPAQHVAENGEDAYVQQLVDGIRTVAEEFYPRPVRVRTLDAPSDEFRRLEGGENEPEEHNPMLGYRGIRRSLNEPDLFALELEAFRRLHGMGYDNVEILFPLVNDAEDAAACREALDEAGMDPEKHRWGAMVETPAGALSIEEIIEEGIDFVSFGTNDLTQYTLAVDRNNETVADRYDPNHPAVRSLLADVTEVCREHDVGTSICGEAGSDPEMVRFLVNEGVTSVSANIDAVRDMQHEVKREEQRLLLDSVR